MGRKRKENREGIVDKLSVRADLTGARRVRDAYEGRFPGGIFGLTQSVPELDAVAGIKDERMRVLFITNTVSIDYVRDTYLLWNWARRLYEDRGTRWIFSPAAVVRRRPDILKNALQSKGRLRYPRKDLQFWFENSRIWARSYRGDPRRLFEEAGWNVGAIEAQVRRLKFKGLGGPKIFPLWLRILATVEGYEFRDVESLRIPVDIHVARATFTVGLLKGSYKGPFDSRLRDKIIAAWRQACQETGDMPISFDEALWQLSRLGCRHGHEKGVADCPKRTQCPIGEICPAGKIRFSVNSVEIDT